MRIGADDPKGLPSARQRSEEQDRFASVTATEVASGKIDTCKNGVRAGHTAEEEERSPSSSSDFEDPSRRISVQDLEQTLDLGANLGWRD